jgi:AcrR family transcriptional regulator
MTSTASRDGATSRSRPYRSPKRKEQARRTRERILAVSTELFCVGGYAGTTMAAIAAAAVVSVPAIELAFGTKAAVLKAAIDVAIAGDDEPIPVLERPWAIRAQAATTPEEFLAVIAEVLVSAALRSDALVLAAFEAARSDERLGPLAAQLKAQRAVTAAWIVDGVAARAAYRTGIDRAQAIDVVWLLMEPAVFDRLTTDRGWTAARFGQWFADSALRLLTEGSSP